MAYTSEGTWLGSEAAVRGHMIARDIQRGYSAAEAHRRAESGRNSDGSLTSRREYEISVGPAVVTQNGIKLEKVIVLTDKRVSEEVVYTTPDGVTHRGVLSHWEDKAGLYIRLGLS